jgi:hypothetical protein
MSADGKWHFTAKTPLGEQETTFEFVVNGATLTGEMTAPESIEIYGGSANGDDVAWKVDVTKPLPMKVSFTGTIDGDTMSGKAKGGLFPAFGFTGTRV